ncbi:MAG: stage V sporulation T C-terminal domain-containing protein, partial [Porcipelethomonas sp.]
ADANFNSGTKIADNLTPIVRITKSKGEILSVNIISEGDPLEIYTSNDGEVIFRKYSAISEMGESATQVADIMYKLAGCPVIVFDRDHVVAVAGVSKKEFNERRVSSELEELMESRGQYIAGEGSTGTFIPAEGVDKNAIACMPILNSGDVSGAVAFMASDDNSYANPLQKSLLSAAAQFLGRQIEG